jgi:hypothetical protein
MDIRAPLALIKASVSSTEFRTGIPSRRFDRYAIYFSRHADCLSGAVQAAFVQIMPRAAEMIIAR